jgi:Spy/CpxP family protein refolding chaperone
MNKPWKVILMFLGVFIAGGLCGAALGIRFFHGPPPGGRNPVRVDIMDRLDKGLKLTPEQKEKIKPIVQRTQEETQRLRRENVRELAAVMDRMHTEVAAELTPEQRVKLEEMRKRFRERAERVRGFFHDRQLPPPPPPPDDKTT